MNKNFVFTSLMLITPLLGQAGVISGGGGKGVVCRNADGTIQSAETLDLYEGRVFYGLQSPIESNESAEIQVKQALQRIPEIHRGIIGLYAQKVQQNLRLAPRGSELTPINDSFEAVLPTGCKAEQLANYYNDSLILINQDIWNGLNETNKAALILHEAVYAVERILGARDSRRSRHVVASIFDRATNWVDPKDQAPEDSLLCTTDKGGLLAWAYKDASGQWNMQFQILGGNRVMSKKQITLNDQKMDLMEAKTFPISKGDDLIGSSLTTFSLAQSNFEDGDTITVKKTWEGLKDISDGSPIPGYQTPRYYISWSSGFYPGTSSGEAMLNCTMQALP